MKVYILLLNLLLIGGVLYSQDTTTNTFSKELSFFIEGNSGTLVNNTDGCFTDNEFIMGIQYQQNSTKTPWLSMYLKLTAKGGINFNRINFSINSLKMAHNIQNINLMVMKVLL